MPAKADFQSIATRQRCLPENDTCTHLLSNLHHENSTVAIPFRVFPDTAFAQRLKKLRVERKLKQQDVSLRAGLTKDLVPFRPFEEEGNATPKFWRKKPENKIGDQFGTIRLSQSERLSQ